MFVLVWAYGDNWPYGGELDIVEGANDAHSNIISAHTADGCVQTPSTDNLFLGQQRNSACSVGNDNIGCGYNPSANDTTSYGDSFNAINGGVYAMQWDSAHIRVWHFPRNQIPQDIVTKEPQPDNWGLPEAIFGGSSCEVDQYWKNMKLVLNINFCGDYGNAIWGQGTCSQYAPTCAEYVANNPEAFSNAYWDVNYIDAYTLLGSVDSSLPNVSTGNLTASPHGSNITATPLAIPSAPPTPVALPPLTTLLAPSQVFSPTNPINVRNHNNLGCFSSKTGFQSFKKAGSSKSMTIEQCVDVCGDHKYLGVFETDCYCADGLDDGTFAMANSDQCNLSCPGDQAEFCGGYAPADNTTSLTNMATPTPTLIAPMRRRIARAIAASHPILLTVYGAVNDVKPDPPPPMATGIPAKAIALITSTVTYTTIHPTLPSQFAQAEFTATITVTHCGCATPSPISVPMTTTVQSCNGCGPQGEHSATLTIPRSKWMGPTPTPTPTILVAGAEGRRSDMTKSFVCGMVVLGWWFWMGL